ncbi:ATP-binding protein [Undibacterium sp. WLX3042]|uniref:ATP-binding protein n=1 Tax=Undibacterium sp. WLX3042 TaxID=3412686 RepID=UPI003C30B5B1
MHDMEFTPEELLQQLRELDEHPRIEAKLGRDAGDSVMQTVCAFANEPGLGGGFLMLGVAEPDDAHAEFWVAGVTDSDKLLGDLQHHCRDQFEQPIPVRGEAVLLEGQRVLIVFVPELIPAAKPCVFKGKYDSKNKRKSGIWRRGLNGDYECSQQELEPILLAKAGTSFEQVVPAEAEWEDLDPAAIALYRALRQKVRPHAEELQASDEEMLHALNLVKRQNGQLLPNVAGLLLLGKPLALRRLLPAIRVDYVRIVGTQWVEDPEQRFATTLDIREPLLRLIPKLEAAILDDMPRHFRLREGDTQRSDEPLLPQKVIREAIVNAVMHRDYQVNQPILVVRYSNRLEIRNAGYSLKPNALLGEMGSIQRNPCIASVLYDLDFAETKGSGIRTMRRLLENAGLTAPVFASSSQSNLFTATYLLHQLMDTEQLQWLQQFSYFGLNDDEAKALILARETGAVDNASLRAITGLDTLSASQVLRKLHHQRELLVQGGASSATYYQLRNLPELPLFDGVDTSDLTPNTSDLDSNTSDLRGDASDLPPELLAAMATLGTKPRREKLWPVIIWLCAIRSHTAEELAARLGNRQVTALKSQHLSLLREQEKLLQYSYPEVVNHPQQAYATTAAGRAWLAEQGITVYE